MKRKISGIKNKIFGLRYPILLFGVIVASVFLAATSFAADLTTIEINYKGKITEITCHNATVDQALKDAGIILAEDDIINCSTAELLSDVPCIQITDSVETVLDVPGNVYSFPSTHGNAIDYALELSDRSGMDILSDEERRVAEATPVPTQAPAAEETTYVTEVWDIDFETVYTADGNMFDGESKVTQQGVKGQRQVEYVVKKAGGKVISKDVVKSTVLKEAVNKLVTYGTKKRSTTAKGLSLAYKSVHSNFQATAYSALEPGNVWGYSTSYGIRAQAGVIAVDPKVIPLGTKVYVEGVGGNPDYGYAIAADTGGAIKGSIIDVYIENLKECNNWGRKRVNVYVLEDQSVNIFNLR